MFDFGEVILEDTNLFPAVNPTVMEGVEIPLPPEIGRLAEVFKSDALKDIQHEVVSPGKPNKRKVGNKIAEMSFKSRQDLKKKGVLQITGRKLYVTGGAIRDWLINHFHGIAHPQDDWDLATDASPEALKLILKIAIETGSLPEDTALNPASNRFNNLELTISGKTFEITTFPFAGHPDAPRMYLDSMRRNFSANALYYSIDEKKIYDYHSGITDIYRKQPNFIGKARKKLKEESGSLYPMVYARLHARMNSKDGDDTESVKEIKNHFLPHDISRTAVYAELQKGVKQSLDKGKYFKLLHDLGILKQIFPSLRVDPAAHMGDMTLFPQVLAQILKPNWNSLGHLAEVLKRIDFHQREIHDIIFLLKLPTYTDEGHLKSDRLHTGMSDRAIEQFIKVTNPKNGEWVRSAIRNSKKPIQQPQPVQPQQGEKPTTPDLGPSATHHGSSLSGVQEQVPPVLQVARSIVEGRRNGTDKKSLRL
jgi:tRNA nucleotidyltransferase/poly(A) polymerase